MNTLINLEDDIAPVMPLTAEQAFNLGTTVATLESEISTMTTDYDRFDRGITTLSNLEHDNSEAYAVALSAIASDVGVSVDTLNTESKAVEFVKKLFQIAHTFIVKLTATAKKLFAKVMAWVVASDKKRDEYIKKFIDHGDKEIEGHSVTTENMKKLVAKDVLAEAGFTAPKKKDQEVVINAVNNEADAKEILDIGKKAFTEDYTALKAMNFKDKLADLGNDSFVVIDGYSEDKVRVVIFTVVDEEIAEKGHIGETVETTVVTDRVELTLAEVAEKITVPKTGKDALELTNKLPTSNELQSRVNDSFSSMETMTKQVKLFSKDVDDNAAMAKSIKTLAIAFSKAAYTGAKSEITAYKDAMKIVAELASVIK